MKNSFKKILKEEFKYSKEERKSYLESLRKFSQFKESIYSSRKLKEIDDEITSLVELCESMTMNETEDGWFDNITVSRDMKRLKESHKTFSKTMNEMTRLQQRLESCYDDMGVIFSRYYEI